MTNKIRKKGRKTYSLEKQTFQSLHRFADAAPIKFWLAVKPIIEEKCEAEQRMHLRRNLPASRAPVSMPTALCRAGLRGSGEGVGFCIPTQNGIQPFPSSLSSALCGNQPSMSQFASRILSVHGAEFYLFKGSHGKEEKGFSLSRRPGLEIIAALASLAYAC